jgi:hypothetical protein
MRIPIGFVYDATGRVVLDPDQQVQQTTRVFLTPSVARARQPQR